MPTEDDFIMKLYELIRAPATAQAQREGRLLSYLRPLAQELMGPGPAPTPRPVQIPTSEATGTRRTTARSRTEREQPVEQRQEPVIQRSPPSPGMDTVRIGTDL